MIPEIGYLRADAVALVEQTGLPSVEDIRSLKAPACRTQAGGTFAWAQRGPATSADGNGPLVALLIARCGLVEGREGSFPFARCSFWSTARTVGWSWSRIRTGPPALDWGSTAEGAKIRREGPRGTPSGAALRRNPRAWSPRSERALGVKAQRAFHGVSAGVLAAVSAASLAVVFAGVAGPAAAAEPFPNGLAPIDTGAPALASVEACAGCHARVHADWARSRHGRAFTNAIFQREYRDRPLDWCVHCHAPLREQLAEVRRGGGPLADEGITCAACHVRGGRVIARVHSAASPHDTEVRADFGSPSFCAGCHQFNFPRIEDDPTHAGPGRVVGYTAHPMQDTVHQHERGPYAAAPCLTCHAAGDGGHRFPGGHDPGMLARAATVEACRAGPLLELRLTNVGAGHNLPTGDLHRHLVLRAWRASAPERLHETVLGRRFAPAQDGGKTTIADDTLPPGTTRAVRLSPAALGPRDGRDEPISIRAAPGVHASTSCRFGAASWPSRPTPRCSPASCRGRASPRVVRAPDAVG